MDVQNSQKSDLDNNNVTQIVIVLFLCGSILLLLHSSTKCKVSLNERKHIKKSSFVIKYSNSNYSNLPSIIKCHLKYSSKF